MINIIGRRAAWSLFAFCLSFSAVADSYHPHIVKSQVVSLDVASIERAANSKTPFELAFGNTSLNVVLAPEPVGSKEGLRVLDVGEGEKVTERIVPDNITYAGEVVGEDPETSEARFTIANGVIDAYVMSESGWWFIEPLSRFDPKAAADQYLVYATRDLDFAIDFGDDNLNEEIYEPWDGPPSPDGRIPVVMVADFRYATYSGSSPYEARHATLINFVNGIYLGQTGRRFRIAVSIGDFGDSFLTATFGPPLLARMKAFIDFAGGGATDPEAPGTLGMASLGGRIAHLTSTNLDYFEFVPLRSRFGIAKQALIPLGSGNSGAALSFQNMMWTAHVVGHTFDGVHFAADCICVDDGLFGCDDYQRTLMWGSFHSDNQPRFSDGTQDFAHNNKKRIRDFMTMQGF